MNDNEQVKYPRTSHLPFSPGATSDDKWIGADGLSYLQSGIELIVTEKMDGGNLTFTRDHFFARSIDSGTHVWDNVAKSLWAVKRFDIPQGWRISGESMLARRSVAYDNLPGPFIVFGIWDDTNSLLSWDYMIEWTELLELPVVPLLYRGNSFNDAKDAWGKSRDASVSEGYVMRDSGIIAYDDFNTKVAKWVRNNHVQTSDYWRHRDDFGLNKFASQE